MGNLVNLPNISLDSFSDDGKTAKKKNSAFDTKHYLNVKLEDGEEEKTLTVRLLPMDLETGNPFVFVHTHNVKVPKEVAPSGWKSYICLQKNKDIDHATFGDKCPFCEINHEAYEASTKEQDPVKKKQLQEISIANVSRESVILRCIERGKEDEGVKFWKFNLRSDKTDPYNQIKKIASLRSETAKKKGKECNILDIYNGRDLNITITAEGTSAPTIVDDAESSPLSENEEQMRQWIYDSKKWQDVFAVKTYDYLSLISQMKTPWFDNKTGKWVDKNEYESARKSVTSKVDSDIEEANKKLSEMAQKSDKNTSNDIVSALTLNNSDDGLPF